MYFFSIRAFVFTLIYIAILLVKIKAQENITSSVVELSTNRTEEPDSRIVKCIFEVPTRRNQTCRRGEKRGLNGKCRPTWWGEIKIRFFMCLNATNKAAHFCLLSKWSECYMRGELGLFCQILSSSKILIGILICDIWVCHGVHCEEYDRNISNYLWFSQLYRASWYYQSLSFTSWCTIELL
jgi:hypothetical protein